jgi:hypothetical protein
MQPPAPGSWGGGGRDGADANWTGWASLTPSSSARTGPRSVMDRHVSARKPWRIQNQQISLGKAGIHWHQVWVFHQNVLPNFTVVNIGKLPCFLCKFSSEHSLYCFFFWPDISWNPWVPGLLDSRGPTAGIQGVDPIQCPAAHYQCGSQQWAPEPGM